MNSISIITDKILAASQEKADAILADAHSKAAELLSRSAEQTDKEVAAIAAESAAECALIIARAESQAKSDERRALLTAKGEAINKSLGLAAAAVLALPEERYAALMSGVLSRTLTTWEGDRAQAISYGETVNGQEDGYVLCLNKSDYKKSVLREALYACAKKITSVPLTISGEPVDIDGGFVIRRGDIDINCSVTALIEASRERLTPKIMTALFE